ncbi:Uu.00g092100.m01.CDS01 [Anthostomella pinea]|uniref:Elongator complex protein 2 n=1 Tax=Anthostomella pinea TaxID=933095 RepID=A0AAI8YI13_9PEZI|nr:Uu.00g092100.m01.CDS01 [Anthostomella pinea]
MNEEGLKVEYLSAGANRHTAVADWSQDGVVAYGADSNIALWRPHDNAPRGVTSLLAGHTGVVKAVKFLPKAEGEDQSYLLSGADDHSLRIWTLTVDSVASCIQTIHEHTAAVNCIATLHPRGKPGLGTRMFATGAADASIKVWTFDGAEARVVQTIKPNPKFFPLSIALSKLDEDGDSLVLAAAGTRDIIQIFVASSTDSPDFQVQATLSGHEGWIRSLDFTRESSRSNSDLILASASQDKYVRLWRFHQGKELPAATVTGADASLGAFLPGKSPSNKAYRLKAGEADFSITFEALLLGHDDWIYSAKWYSVPDTGKLQLLSTSADNTLAIWVADPSSGIWVTTVRVGEISREKGATTATGSTGGFWTGLWSPDGTSVTCLGRTGSWRLWNYNKEQDQWVPEIGISGHTRAVTGISWSGNGDYLLSTSSDQTTRLHAGWKTGGPDAAITWHEMARPQIHGYDLNCIDALGNSQFVSGADEKLMRVFDEPKAVAKLLNKLCDIGGGDHIESMPDAANMPVLGLSNKAIEAVDDDTEVQAANPEADREALDPGSTVRKSALDIDHPPFEDSLSRHTLWPETEKLYGHGYEISCLAVSHDGSLIASACKASSINHAVIRLFETEKWTEVKPPLTAHSLTTTRLRFSPDDRFLLSVGRDRQWAVFERDADDRLTYKLLQSNPKGHSRMILDAAWAPATATDSLVFATAGRDKQVKIWRRKGSSTDAAESGIVCVTTITETHPVTAVDFLHRNTEDGTFLLAVGTETGKVSINTIDSTSLAVSSSLNLKPEFCLAKAVLQLAWRPQSTSNELAIAGEDSSLRLYSFDDPKR